MAPRPEYSAMPQVVTITKLLLNLQSWTESVSLQWPGCNSALLLRLSYFAVHYFALSPNEFIWLSLILMSTDFLMSNKRASQVRCWIFLKGTKHYYFPSHWEVGQPVWEKKKKGKINVHKVWTGFNPCGYVYSLSIYPPGTGLNKIVDEMDASLTNRAIHFLNALLIILFK